MKTIYFSLGANLGEREKTLLQALELIEERVGKLLRRSAFFYSEPWGFSSENGFCNICASFLTTLSPEEILDNTQAIEYELGRRRGGDIVANSVGIEKSAVFDDAFTKINQIEQAEGETQAGATKGIKVYHDRPIDIDLLCYIDEKGEEIKCQTERLTLPHPLMHLRDFVLVPLAEITKEEDKTSAMLS